MKIKNIKQVNTGKDNCVNRYLHCYNKSFIKDVKIGQVYLHYFIGRKSGLSFIMVEVLDKIKETIKVLIPSQSPPPGCYNYVSLQDFAGDLEIDVPNYILCTKLYNHEGRSVFVILKNKNNKFHAFTSDGVYCCLEQIEKEYMTELDALIALEKIAINIGNKSVLYSIQIDIGYIKEFEIPPKKER